MDKSLVTCFLTHGVEGAQSAYVRQVNFRGHVTLATHPFREILLGIMSGLSLGICISKFESAPITILEQLAFNAFLEKLLSGHVWTVPGNMLVKSEVRSFNRIGASSI